MLLIAAEGAADGIQQETLGLIDGVLREMLEIEASGSARHIRGDGFFGGSSFFNGGQNISLG